MKKKSNHLEQNLFLLIRIFKNILNTFNITEKHYLHKSPSLKILNPTNRKSKKKKKKKKVKNKNSIFK